MFMGDAPRPVPRQVVLQGFWLASASKGGFQALLQQSADFLLQFWILIRQLAKLLPSLVGKNKLHKLVGSTVMV